MPVHCVELSHLVLLNVEVQDTGGETCFYQRELVLMFEPVFKQSDFAIINTDENSDFDFERKLSMRDARGRKLDLFLNYVYVILL